MALEFNAQFTRFVEFAQTQTRAHNDGAIARDSGVNAEGEAAYRAPHHSGEDRDRKGRRCHQSRYTILSEEMDRLAELDFKAYDDTVAENFIADQTVNQPYNTLSKNMGKNFEFRHVECHSKFKITVK